ncbi:MULTISPECIES: S41 family peptidase [unclassified Fusibacter]|uniref:S41 family peptidase n=1 Tax=unclassified Fusibacter TaxID=2624464 RepID=UPI001010D774|nr:MULTISPECIES: S41 family peptidase [unclassified Fusibacter]MCK8059999.1 S41 family peptidase [Fusibacter sp. A2]NPE22139.1 PDZ domain-containing protein [Fusibacter sp. A1]RXV60917.1 PDZ domain-containing protein [Fusibacter sp. A1]
MKKSHIVLLLIIAIQTFFLVSVMTRNPSESDQQKITIELPAIAAEADVNIKPIISGALPPHISDDLSTLWASIENESVFPLSEENALNAMKEALVASLNDPYSQWLSNDDYDELTQSIDSDYAGIGIDLIVNDDEFVIANVLKNGNAYKAKLLVGDKLIKLNHIELHGNYDLFEAARSMSKNSIDVTYERDERTYETHIELLPYHEPSVTHQALSDEVYYIDINTFSQETLQLFEEALSQVKDGDYGYVIYDLRFNFGGWMDICYDMLSLVNDENDIAYIKDLSGVISAQRTRDQYIDTTPYVLINNDSYSAAELFAQGMRLHDSAVIIGETSYGKGVMQGLYETDDGVLKLSVAHFSAGLNDFFTNIGIVPDYPSPAVYRGNVDSQLNKAIELIMKDSE